MLGHKMHSYFLLHNEILYSNRCHLYVICIAIPQCKGHVSHFQQHKNRNAQIVVLHCKLWCDTEHFGPWYTIFFYLNHKLSVIFACHRLVTLTIFYFYLVIYQQLLWPVVAGFRCVSVAVRQPIGHGMHPSWRGTQQQRGKKCSVKQQSMPCRPPRFAEREKQTSLVSSCMIIDSTYGGHFFTNIYCFLRG